MAIASAIAAEATDGRKVVDAAKKLPFESRITAATEPA
jgi:hypothetical protein